MSSNEHLAKWREEREAREKARIQKLRELNLKKYNKLETAPTRAASVVSVDVTNKKKTSRPDVPKNNFHVKGNTKRPITAPDVTDTLAVKNSTLKLEPKATFTSAKLDKRNLGGRNEKTNGPPNKNFERIEKKVADKLVNGVENTKGVTLMKPEDKAVYVVENTSKIPTRSPNADNKSSNFVKNSHRFKIDKNSKGDSVSTSNKNVEAVSGPKRARNSSALRFELIKTKSTTTEKSRKSMLPSKVSQSSTKVNPNRQSVFERLYQPKVTAKKHIASDSDKLLTDPNFLKKVIKNTGIVMNKRHTVFEPQIKKAQPQVRRSISAVHLKRISKNELPNCIHKWSSIGEKLDKDHLKEVNEDESVNQDRIVSAVKSDLRRVKFQTPVSFNFNTPRPEELQARLQNWLKKRGKSIDSYHHLQCFGLNHMAQKEITPLKLDMAVEQFNDEDKENQPLESDSDNDSFDNNMNNKEKNTNEWRRASYVSDSVDFNETCDSTLTSSDVHHVDELLLGALNDLTELLREGFEWEQCARWLRAIRERFPSAPDSAAYWECRAALEERRGDLHSYVQCCKEAIAKGTECSTVMANLDQLLDKFMELKISPGSGKAKQPNPKMVDVKNVFKSTVIRFAVQQAKLRQSQEPAKFTVTPVRRSARLSSHWSGKRTPLQVCSSVRQAGLLGHDIVFVRNDKLDGTP